jgi:hypothetical protein
MGMCDLGNADYEQAETAEINTENNNNDIFLRAFFQREKQSRKSGLI